MQSFLYTAKDNDGEIQKGTVEAENKTAAAKVLSSRNLIPISLEKEKTSSFTLFDKISLKDKVIIARQLATMINAGLPLAQSIRTLQDQVKKDSVKRMLEQISTEIEGGAQLSTAFGQFPKVFTVTDLTLIAAGETSGNLDKALTRLATSLEGQQSLLRKVRGAMIYPIFLVVIVIIVVIALLTYVMPQMEELYVSFDAKLPILTRFLIATSHALTKFAPLFLIVIIGIILFIRFYIKTPAGRKIWDQLKITIFGLKQLLTKVYMARFAGTLASLVGSGVPLLEGLSITSKAIGNVIYEKDLMEATEKVKAGIALSDPLKENPLYPAIVPQMISVGEKTGELDKMLENLNKYFEDELEVLVKNLSNLIEPILIVVIGGLIGIIMLGIMLPIYSLGALIM